MESNDESESESDLEDIINDVDPNLLQIERFLTDDLFVGRLSKYVFKRAQFQEHVRLTYSTEITLYIRHHILPTLREILIGKDSRFYIWLATNIEFRHETNTQETCNRWSSFR